MQQGAYENFTVALVENEPFVVPDCAQCGFIGAENYKVRNRGPLDAGRTLDVFLLIKGKPSLETLFLSFR